MNHSKFKTDTNNPTWDNQPNYNIPQYHDPTTKPDYVNVPHHSKSPPVPFTFVVPPLIENHASSSK